MRRLVLAATVVATMVGTAHADDDEEEAPKGKEPLSFAGRVFSRFTALSVESSPWTGELTLDSARVAVNYVWKEKLRTKVSIEAAHGPEVKDAFVEVDAGGGVTVRGGHFKLPISAIEQSSSWTLPTIDRGVVADILADGLTLTGRRDAVQASWACTCMTVTATVSQSVTTLGEDPARTLSDGAGLAATLRVEREFAYGVKAGVFGSNREVVHNLIVDRYWAGGADAEVDYQSLRLWTDAIVAEGPFGTSAAAQLAGGWRLGGKKKNKKYVEPFVLAAHFNPDLDRKGDGVTEGALGLAGGRWKRWRAQGQFSMVSTDIAKQQANLGGDSVAIPKAVAVTMQLGAAF
jgi:hypothetical protein